MSAHTVARRSSRPADSLDAARPRQAATARLQLRWLQVDMIAGVRPAQRPRRPAPRTASTARPATSALTRVQSHQAPPAQTTEPQRPAPRAAASVHDGRAMRSASATADRAIHRASITGTSPPRRHAARRSRRTTAPRASRQPDPGTPPAPDRSAPPRIIAPLSRRSTPGRCPTPRCAPAPSPARARPLRGRRKGRAGRPHGSRPRSRRCGAPGRSSTLSHAASSRCVLHATR